MTYARARRAQAGGFADDEVALPMAGLGAAFNDLRTIMDRRSILDRVARGSGATRATALVAPCQITPQGLCLLSGSIDEGVDCLAADGPQPRFRCQTSTNRRSVRASIPRRAERPRRAADHGYAQAEWNLGLDYLRNRRWGIGPFAFPRLTSRDYCSAPC